MPNLRTVVPAVVALGLCWSAARAADLDPYAPADSEWVLHLNARQLAAAPAVKKYAANQLRIALTTQAPLLKPLTALGLDPLRDVDTVAAAGSGLPEDRQSLLIVRGGFTAEAVRKTAAGLVTEQPAAWKAVKQGETTLYEMTDKSGKVLAYLAVPRDGTLLVSAARKYVTAAVAVDLKKPVKVSEALRKLAAQADSKDDLWLASVTPKRIRAVLAKSPYAAGIANDVNAFTGRLTATSDVKITFSVHTRTKKSAEEVAQLLDAAKGLASVAVANADGVGPLLSDLIDACKTSTDGANATLAGQLSEEQVARALKKK
jgi:hypothetical protein